MKEIIEKFVQQLISDRYTLLLRIEALHREDTSTLYSRYDEQIKIIDALIVKMIDKYPIK